MTMSNFNLPKILFFTVSIGCLVLVVFVSGVYSGVKQNILYRAINSVQILVIQSLGEIPNLIGTRPKYFLQPARYEGSGVTVNEITGNSDLVFITGFFEGNNEIRLIRRNGDIVARWPVKFSQIFPNTDHLRSPPTTDWNVDTHGSLILPDGSVIFNFEYSGLVKLDRCGNVVWKLARQTHHSIERAEGGGFWVPGRRQIDKDTKSPFYPFASPLIEDTIMKISEDGKLLTEISVPQLFYDNGLSAVLTATGEAILFDDGQGWGEIVHLNKIEELTSDIADDFPMFNAGDLALSFRKRNLIMVMEPDTGKVKWWQIGPWVRQHDPEFMAGGRMIVFNNNIYRNAFGKGDRISRLSAPRVSNIIEFDFSTGRHRSIYGNKPGQEMLTTIRGKQEPTSNGGLLITEFEGGRVFETNADNQIVWEYINRYNKDEVAEITEARIYPENYFDVTHWNCKEDSA